MIDKVCNQIWIGPPMPDHIARYMQTWRELHPRWQFVLWDDDALADLRMVNRALYDQAESYCLPGRVEQFRSDIARYEILLQFGGLYVDADYEAQRPVDLFMDSPAWLAWEQQGVWASNAIMAAGPAHSLLQRLVFDLPRHVEAVVSTDGPVSTARLSGPRYLTKKIRETNANVEILDEALFFPYSWNELDRSEEPFPQAYAIHHWQNQRRIHGKERPS